MGAEAAWLPGGRLHLHHGPIDLVIGAEGHGAAAAFDAARRRFAPLLEQLVAELPLLRRPAGEAAQKKLEGPVAARMQAAAMPFRSEAFITPMAAVAGAVADEILAAMVPFGLTRAYVNNGGDIAVHLRSGEEFTAELAGTAARLRLRHSGGIATSGAGGRSLSRGIADSVTVLAGTAATADAAATLIANAVDLPDHPAVHRAPASSLQDDSDLGTRLITLKVGPLTPAEIARALDTGLKLATKMRSAGTLKAALLHLRGQTVTTTGASPLIERKDHA